MASDNFERALAFTLAYEGGFSDHPDDPGGPTMRGVTQRVYDAWRVRSGKTPRTVALIEDAELRAIYRAQYWKAVRADELPAGLDLMAFDTAVLAGPVRAAKLLQAALGVRADGAIGEATLLAAGKAEDVDAVILAACALRLRFLRSLRTFATFGGGWSARVTALEKAALAAAARRDFQRVPSVTGGVPPQGRASDADQKLTSTTTGQGAVTGVVGVAGSTLTEAAQQLQPVADFAPVLRVVFAMLVLAGVGLTLWGALRTARSHAELA